MRMSPLYYFVTVLSLATASTSSSYATEVEVFATVSGPGTYTQPRVMSMVFAYVT